MKAFQSRREIIYDWMAREGIALVMLEDFENSRNPSVRWLSGQPGDALLFLSVDRKSLLVPWDINLAMLYANADKLLPYAEFDRQPVKALKGAIEGLKIPFNSKVEIPGNTAYPNFLKFVDELSDFDIICRESGIIAEIEKHRAVKDENEITIYRKVSAFTDEIINMLEEQIKKKKLKTEADVALFIESECRKMGCEGTGFDIIAAGPGRSFGIHAFPSYTGAEFGGQGLSILDFGLKYAGYTSDVTLTFAGGTLVKAQEDMISLVEKAYSLAFSMVKSGEQTKNIARSVTTLFGRSKKTMPHALGHGIGLEAHEAPSMRNREDNEWVLEPGMIIAVEPGLYDPVHGGCRLENDILIKEDGIEVLTNSRIIRI